MAGKSNDPRSIVEMHQCPRCWQEWIQEHHLVCPKCEPALHADLVVHDLIKAVADLQKLPQDQAKRHKNSIELLLESLSDFVNFL